MGFAREVTGHACRAASLRPTVGPVAFIGNGLQQHIVTEESRICQFLSARAFTLVCVTAATLRTCLLQQHSSCFHLPTYVATYVGRFPSSCWLSHSTLYHIVIRFVLLTCGHSICELLDLCRPKSTAVAESEPAPTGPYCACRYCHSGQGC